MDFWQRLRKQAGIVALVLGLATAPLFARPQELTHDQARSLVINLMETDQLAAALQLAYALRQSYPRDPEILLLIARAEAARQRYAVAADAAAAAWKLSPDRELRFRAAIVAAQAHVDQDGLTQAQLWLRRASDLAPNAEASLRIAQDFAILRQVNPLGLSLAFNLAPSSNVNNGSLHQTTTFDGLPGVWTLLPEGQALSGIDASLQAGVTWRVAKTARSQTRLEFGLIAREVIYSAEALAFAPEADASLQAFHQLSLGLGHRWKAGNDRDFWSAGFAINRRWSGHQIYSDSAALRLGREWRANPRVIWTLGATGEHSLFAAGVTSTAWTIAGARTSILGNGDRFSIGLELTGTDADRRIRDYHGVDVSLSYDFGEVIPHLDLAVTYDLEFRKFPAGAGILGPRHDARHSLRTDLGFKAAKFYGFIPVLSIEASRNLSNVNRSDTFGVKAGISLRSEF